MSNKELKRRAYAHLNPRWGTVLGLTLFKFALLLAFVAAEALIYEILNRIGIEYSFTPSFVFGTHLGRFMVGIRILLFTFFFVPESYILRRLMIDIYLGRNFIETRKYIQYNLRRLSPKITAGAVVPMMLRFFALVPLAMGALGIYYWGWHRAGEKLTTLGLFIFMLSIGFTIVWTGVYIHYSISLKLTKYILALNPRVNVFDACDLSVRLMEGQHTRYIWFVLSFFKSIPFLLLIFPIIAVEPMYRMSETAFAEDVMGNYWQDKYPAMIHRWSKYVDRISDN